MESSVAMNANRSRSSSSSSSSSGEEYCLEDLPLFADPDGFYKPDPQPTFAQYQDDDGYTMNLRLVGSHSLWAHHLWNASIVAAKLLKTRYRDRLPGWNILELGSGAGLPSITAHRHGAQRVVATDYPEEQIIQNLEINAKVHALHVDSYGQSVVATGLLWGSDLNERLRPATGLGAGDFDMVIMSDLVFNHAVHHEMLQTAWDALRPGGTALVAFTHHRPHRAHKDMAFFQLAASEPYRFTVTRLEDVKMQPMFPEDPGDVEVRSTVQVYEFTKSA